VGPPPAPAATPAVTVGSNDQETASQIARAYLADLIAGRYAEAWARLAPWSQTRWGTLQSYASERAAFYRSAGPEFRLSPPDSSDGTVGAWLPPDFNGDRQRTSVIELEYVRISSQAALSVLLVAPDSAGVWRVWIVR
jgi:hypothetical protein